MPYWGGPEGTANFQNYARSDLHMTIREPPNAPKFTLEERAQAIRAKWTVKNRSVALDKFYFLPLDDETDGDRTWTH